MTDIDKWSQRRLRHCKHYGIKSDVASEKLRSVAKIDTSEATSPLEENDTRRATVMAAAFSAHTHTAHTTAISRTQSLDRTRITHLTVSAAADNLIGGGEKRETVFQMACKGLNSVVNGDLFRQMKNSAAASHRGHSATVSRIPTYISVRYKDRTLLGYSSFPSMHNTPHNGNGTNGNQRDQTKIVQYGAGMITPSMAAKTPETVCHQNREISLEPSPVSPPPTTSTANFFVHPPQDQIDDLEDDAIFDVLFFQNGDPQTDGGQLEKVITNGSSNNNSHERRIKLETRGDNNHLEEIGLTTKAKSKQPKQSKFGRFVGGILSDRSDGSGVSRLRSLTKFNFSIRRAGGQIDDDVEEEKPTKMPIYGRFISDPELIKRLKDDSCDYRPFFTYWISTVHMVVLLAMLFNYGIGTDFTNILFNPFGVIERSGDVMTSSLSAAHIVVWEQNNIWIGPKYADLVHAGAKYTPCMRRDEKIYEQILQERRIEAETTGCCIGPWGCYQTSECPKQFAQLLKWIRGNFPESEHSRVVCGQDQRYCVRPRSVHPVLWGLNISNWPICEQRVKQQLIPTQEKHMHCEVTGRPCCIQMHGQCRITSLEYCQFVGGHYHPNATLCSQVSCLNDVCGMTSFMRRDVPDQIYRLVTPLFIHAGIIRCAISLSIYLTIMRRFEIMIGWLRLSTIYFVSGIGGYLASAVFVPYMPEVGPAGSEGGILGALIVNIVYNWDLLAQPWCALIFHLAIAGFLFVLGFLPWIDNWAQVFGFIFGSFMAIVLIPYITITRGKQHQRLPIVVGSLCATVMLYGVLFILFYTYPINNQAFGLLNCPFPTKICDQQGLILRNWLPI